MPGTTKAPLTGETVGQRIIAAMQHAGLKKAWLAERVGVSWTTVNAWANGSAITAENLRRVADVCGVSMEWLQTGRHITHAIAANDALREFLETPDGRQATVEERAELASFVPQGEASVSFYGALLLLIRSGLKRSLEEEPEDDHETSSVRMTKKAAFAKPRKTQGTRE